MTGRKRDIVHAPLGTRVGKRIKGEKELKKKTHPSCNAKTRKKKE